MTNKVIEFTKEQKSLIWSTKLQPAKATEHEAHAFLEVCEEYGLNPLLGDITFQKYETKWGPRVSYLISRDARLKHAMRQEDFINCLSGVVKEGDHFEVDVAEGIPIHKFGSKRGKILGAWAVVKTKTRGNTVVFPDFAEYFAGLSEKNPVWKSMPSAMIEKVAQSMALSRTFPLGVVFASEDEIVIDTDLEPTSSAQKEDNPIVPATSIVEDLKKARDEKETKKETTKSKKQTVAKSEEKPVTVTKSEPVPQEEVKLPNEKEAPAEEPTTTLEETKKEEPITQPTVEKVPKQEQAPASTSDNSLEFIEGKMGESGNGTVFLRVFYKLGGTEKEAFARGDQIAIFDEFVTGTKFKAQIQEVNGFSFVLSAQAV
jgi:phage recombination protein Bet